MNSKSYTYAIAMVILLTIATVSQAKHISTPPVFPDGTPLSDWMRDTTKIDVNTLGKQYVITDYGISADSTILQTEKIQQIIDRCAADGGGVIVIPKGTFSSGSLFFKPKTHLHLMDGAKLKGSDAIANYSIIRTRLDGKMMDYFAALVNADRCDGFSITGKGTIDGNGTKFWEEFWLRRKVNPKCTNLEALRPRLVYISNSNNVTVQDVRTVNSGYWTNHLYHCRNVRYLDCFIYSPTQGYPKAPSTDAIDLDVCEDVLIRGCYMNVNDDAVCLKGGKGTFVDKDSTSGPVQRIIVENCRFGQANAGITFGSEAWNCQDVILRNCNFNGTNNMILFKMRRDTPQKYCDVSVENITGVTRDGITISKWTQFHHLEKRDDMPRSCVSNVLIKNVNLRCTRTFNNQQKNDYYDIKDIKFKRINAKDKSGIFQMD